MISQPSLMQMSEQESSGSLITHQFISIGVPPITWSNLVATTPNSGSPINAPMLTAGGLFTWQSDALDVPGTYHFDVTATNVSSSDVGRLTVVIVPEPATWLLFAAGGLVGFPRVRRQSAVRCTE